jgi:predicted Zn-dependent protease
MPSSRGSEPYSDPRHSGPIPSRRAGAARWIVGFVLLGCTALAAVTIGPKLIAKPSPSTVALDARVSTLIEQGDRAMTDGDLDAANEAYVKSSALADKDARVELRLTRLAIVRADVPWLKVRLLSEGDPDLANTRRELVLAAVRANQAAERAQAILPNDPDVTRCRIDTLRLQGNIAEARKLVAALLKPAGVSNDELLFALLDLAEPSPTWSSVIERLSNAARGEQNLGHARSMLIYALVQSGDVARAKAELDQLVAMPRPHPLIGAFRAYIARAEKETNAGGAEEAGAPGDDNAKLQSAIEATTNGDLEKAAELLQDLETRLPNDTQVLTAAGNLALKKRDRTNAVKYFEKVVAADKNHFEAMAALANIKWESGERQGASILYRQIIERAGADNPHMAQAKERFSAFTDGSVDEGLQ